MKALILAAGFGTRLLPYTRHTPKSLFTIAGQPLLDRLIRSLEQAGCEAVMVNTHYLHEKIEAFLEYQNYNIPVKTIYEPVILGTGGAIKNAADFWDERPFMVINSDILTDIDLRKVYDYHINHSYPATLVLYNDAAFNHVSVSCDLFVTGFHNPVNSPLTVQRAFTGIQVINPEILDFINDGFFSSIDAYRKMLASDLRIKAFISSKYTWKDLGTPERYRAAAIEEMAFKSLCQTDSNCDYSDIIKTKLKGDGSDRIWYRMSACGKNFIMADHGIRRKSGGTEEVDAFVDIGRHLYQKGISVPEIYMDDRFSGLVFMEDLGDIHLQKLVRQTENNDEIINIYQQIIDLLIEMSLSGAEDFNPSWTWQTISYDREVILEKECRYFIEAFLQRYMGISLSFDDFQDEFELLAHKTIEFSVNGFMHRDMQSRNIMYNQGQFYFIDFQGGRKGPIQYDLASLLIDPYVELKPDIQAQLFEYYLKKISSRISIDAEHFRKGYTFCTLTRNLQILGAFGYLSRVKKKREFEAYIPYALKTLKHILSGQTGKDFPKLTRMLSDLNINPL